MKAALIKVRKDFERSEKSFLNLLADGSVSFPKNDHK